MEGRIDPPSSLLRMTEDSLKQKAREEDLFLILNNSDPIACLFGSSKEPDYYIGKLAVDDAHRGKGLSRQLINAATQEAARRGFTGMRLETRVELRENHRAFRAMGFHLVGASAHEGYDHATSFTFRRPL
ncbi:GNAT family N-acetyltransferase [Nioella aestuarii]|uniref:GNAT family N-acetyltransferase n=1 Tax=Nioella aestuarii TaxID=1662864 RepID=UPI003D7F5B65